MKLHQSKSRLEAFSDSVFAFAATLLVVSLEVPENFALLKEQLRGFLSFGISFFALALLWKVHYNFFRRSRTIDNTIVAANMVLLFVILFFVFPLKFLVSLPVNQTPLAYEDLAQLFILYGLGFVLVFAAISFMYWWSYRHQEDGERPGELLFYARHFGIFVGVGLLSIIIAILGIGIQFGVPGFAYALLGPLCFYHGYKNKLLNQA